MNRIRMTTIGIGIAQAMIWTVFFWAAYAPERIQQVTMIAAAALTVVAGVRRTRRSASLAQTAQGIALLVYGAVAAIWATVEPEADEGIFLMIVTGAILLVIAPPIAGIVTLHFLKRAIARNDRRAS